MNGKAYPIELRERVMRARDEKKLTQKETAELFNIGLTTVKEWCRLQKETGSVAPRPHGGGQKAKIDEKGLEKIQEWVTEKPDLTIKELCAKYSKDRRVVSTAAISRALIRLGLTFKKKALSASEKGKEEVQRKKREFLEQINDVPIKKLHFIDESGVNLSMTQLFARSPKGERVIGSVPSARGANTTILASLSLKGINSIMTIEGSTDTSVFTVYVEKFLLPTIKTGDVVVLDNYGPHKSAKIEELIKNKGTKPIFLPPYHPEYNPIENAWSKMKGILRTLGARTREDLDNAIAKAIKQISRQDILGWFQHCGYGVK